MQLSKRLAEIYGVKAVVVRDGLDVRRFLQFPSMIDAVLMNADATDNAASDPRVDRAREFVEASVDFAPVRAPVYAGHRYYAWITEKDLMARFWEWYGAHNIRHGVDDRALDSKRAWKAVLRLVMAAKGRTTAFIQPGGIGCNAYDRTAFIDDVA
jgi:hypothetical protein